MLIQVRLLQYASKTFTYFVPQSLQEHIVPGTLVQVPVLKRIVPAVVAKIETLPIHYNFVIKPIVSIYPFPQDRLYTSFIQKIGQYYQTDPLFFLRRIQQFLSEKEYRQDIIVPEALSLPLQNVSLTDEQLRVYQSIVGNVREQTHQTFLLHGVTGSGKTEIYKRLIEQALQKSRSVIVMLPDVTLALRFEKIFAEYFIGFLVVGFHCASTVKQKRLLWKNLLEQQPIVIIGVHLPVLLPIANLGLIIVDEEHDHGYQEKKHPKLHSRDMAIMKAKMCDIPVVLGSATPSLQSLWNVQKRGWKLLSLHNRFSGNFPTVQLVLLNKKKKRKNFWITDELYEAIEDRLVKGEQTIIFLNRRGYSFFIQCPCGFVFECYQCSVSLTLHYDQSLLCHYCGFKDQIPQKCPTCHVGQDDFVKKGIGTQQVVSILQKLFPKACIERADLDTTSKQKSWAETVELMQEGKIDILVGTQSITKGYHFPSVTLVGVLWADLNLHFPLYNAAETSLQQLIQVAGRAGRQSLQSLVIIQAFDQHAIFNYLDETRYKEFYDHEILKRIEVGYPPYKHIAEIELKGVGKEIVSQEACLLVELLQRCIQEKKLEVQVLGPIQSLVYKVKSVYSHKVYLKSFNRHAMITLFAQMPEKKFTSSVFFTIDPVA